MNSNNPSQISTVPESGRKSPSGIGKLKYLTAWLLALMLSSRYAKDQPKEASNSKAPTELLQEAISLTTQWWEAGTNFASEEEFHQLVDVYEETKWEHETVVWMQADSDGEIVAVDELESTQKSHGSVSYHAEELNNTQAKSHNHPTESKNDGEVVLQWFSKQDIDSNQKTKEQITQTQWAEAAANYTHFLSKAFEITNEDWKIETYQTVIGSGLDNRDNTQWQTFTIWDKAYNHAVKCPDGKIRDVMDLPTHVAAEILRNRLLAIDNKDENLKIAS